MKDYGKGWWDAVEQRKAMAFLGAGGIWVINTASYLLDILIEFSTPGALTGLLMPAAFLLTLIGVLGFYPLLTERVPRLAVVGTLFIVAAGMLVLVTIVWMVGAHVLNQSLPPGGVLVLILILSLVPLVLFGIASVLADAPSRTSGLFVLALAATWGVWITGLLGLLGATPEWGSAVLGVVLSTITLATGYVLHTSDAPSDHRSPSSTPSAR